MAKVAIELSEDLVDAVKLPPQKIPGRLRRERGGRAGSGDRRGGTVELTGL